MYRYPYSSQYNPNGDQHFSVEIPVHVTGNGCPYRSAYPANHHDNRNSQWRTPVIRVNDFEPTQEVDDHRDAGVSTSAQQRPQIQETEFRSSNRENPSNSRLDSPSNIPIQRDKSFSATNLSDSDLQFPNQSNFRWSKHYPTDFRDYINSNFPQSRHSERPTEACRHWTAPQHPDFNVPQWERAFPTSHEFRYPQYPNNNTNIPYVHCENAPSQSSFFDDFRPYPTRFEQFDPFSKFFSDGRDGASYKDPFDNDNYRSHPRRDEYTPYTPIRPQMHTEWDNDTKQSNPLQAHKQFRRRDSSVPPLSSVHQENDYIDSRLSSLESEFELLLPQTTSADPITTTPDAKERIMLFAQRVKPELIKYVNYPEAPRQSSNVSLNSWQNPISKRAEELLKRLATEEYRSIKIPLPYEHIVPTNRDIPATDKDDANSESKLVDLDQILTQLIEYIDNGLTEQCVSFKHNVDQRSIPADQLDNQYKYIQDEITKTLCKCDAVTGEHLSNDTRKLRKGTVRRLEKMAREIEESYYVKSIKETTSSS